ncbi:hypothetical protein QNE49_001319 [Vibrio fluvialis]|nr:hypothetical protein [Vibrio fluvialis]
MKFILELLDVMYFFSQVTIVPSIVIFGFVVFKKGFSKYQFLFLIPLFSFLITSMSFPYLARENVKSILSDNILIFEVFGVEDKDKVLGALKSLSFIPSNNSHPVGEKITIKIVTNSNRKTLFMYKDHLTNNKYWIYDAQYRYSINNNIGYIIIKE